MASSRHKHALPRRSGLQHSVPARSGHQSTSVHRRNAPSPWRRTAAKVVLPTLGVLTLVGTSALVVVNDAEVAPVAAASAASAGDDIITEALQANPDQKAEVSRSAERPELPDEAAPSIDVTGTEMALEDGVDIHTDTDGDSPVLATLDTSETVDVTGKEKDGWTQVVHKELPRWVKSDEIGKELPLDNPERPLGAEPCPVGSESGLQSDTVKVLRAVCDRFPEISSYGGLAGRGEHATGHALDIMVRGPLGDEIAAFLQENRAELGIEYLIWQQRIWRPATSGSWRGMSSRGGDTANHMDHVHVTTYGTAATG